VHCAFRALWLGLSSNQFQKLIQPDAVTPCNDADRRIWLIRFLNDGKLLSSRPATPPGHYTFCSAGAGSSQVVIMQAARRHY